MHRRCSTLPFFVDVCFCFWQRFYELRGWLLVNYLHWPRVALDGGCLCVLQELLGHQVHYFTIQVHLKEYEDFLLSIFVRYYGVTHEFCRFRILWDIYVYIHFNDSIINSMFFSFRFLVFVLQYINWTHIACSLFTAYVFCFPLL